LLQSAPNFRDIGGYPTADGAIVAKGKIYRSQVVAAPTEADHETLRRIGVRYVCDLRGARERANTPSRWPEGVAPVERNLDIGVDVRAGAERLLALLIEDPTAAGVRRMMTLNYSLLPQAFADGRLKLFLDDLLDGDNFPAVIHCTAGKDRTGFVCAMVLTALGVPEDSVIDDYMLTERFIDFDTMMTNSAHYLKAITGDRISPDDAMLRMLCGVSPDYLAASFAVIEEQYGSVDGYLEETAGLDAAKRERLRELMLG
jgi:protein-tyrosine phosphatase